jgi:NIMA (never in mitosis gene a)-related kinase
MKKVKMEELSEKERSNSLNEIRILASIQHPNIISYKEAFIDEASATLWYNL